ncbi:anaerobic C4-dicarboxylate transporter DcuC [Puniceicoccales bacterium CK1056]|uniref:Anaerobic C4-dicarboxylate transporter DcuC n=2 Tax=Oceanipulchritudo coccoides TaxID=2706888 RepID=A0A6B2M1W5_9BACT|nr:anaerobic C4-dicarboxylate transporter DcuC [Oceanipulchritudo coccoides]
MEPVPHPLERVTQLIAILFIALTVFMVVRRYQTHATLFISGFALLILAYVSARITGNPFTAYEHSPTGWFGFDLFAIVKESFSTRLAKIGLIIMAAGGFARYMSSISASTALVKLSVRPLSNLKNPYLLLAFAYAVGQTLNIFVPSAAGLAMLLLVAMYPTLVELGLRPVSVAAVIGTTACLDLGPASGASNVAASVSGMEPVVYFVRYQLPVAVFVIPVVALLHFLWQRFCDKRLPEEPEQALAGLQDEVPNENVPGFYAFLPILPLVLLLVFSPLVVKSIQVDVVTAMLISLFFSMGCEAIRKRSLREALAGIVHFFKGMGDILAKVVTLIVAAETFATGVKATGLIDGLIGMVQNAGMGSIAMVIALVLLIGFTTLVTGSGNAALFSFANMIPGIASPMGVSTVTMMLPAQLAAGLFRSFSPVAGVIIAVSSAANVSPFAIVKRTSVPMIGGVIVMVIVHALIH